MKAEERHVLKENDLVRALASARTFLEEKGKLLAIVVLGVIAVFVAINVASSTRAASVENAWRQKAELTFATPAEGKESIKKLSVLIGETSDPVFVQAALLEQGSQALRLAQQSEVPPDYELNHLARTAFESLLQRSRDNLFGKAAAQAGLATVAENDFALDQNPKHRETAERHLKEIASNELLTPTPFHALAKDRLANLDSTFSVVRFAATPPPPPPAPVPAPTPEPVDKPDQVEAMPTQDPVDENGQQRRFMRVRMSEDGTLEAVPDDEE